MRRVEEVITSSGWLIQKTLFPPDSFQCLVRSHKKTLFHSSFLILHSVFSSLLHFYFLLFIHWAHFFRCTSHWLFCFASRFPWIASKIPYLKLAAHNRGACFAFNWFLIDSMEWFLQVAVIFEMLSFHFDADDGGPVFIYSKAHILKGISYYEHSPKINHETERDFNWYCSIQSNDCDLSWIQKNIAQRGEILSILLIAFIKRLLN